MPVKYLSPPRVYFILAFIFTSISSAAQDFSFKNKTSLSLQAGREIRRENFKWSIAGNANGESPNILSEINFKNITSDGFYINGAYNMFKRASFTVKYNKLYTHKGSVTDFDFDGDNRTDTATKLYLNSNKGSTNAFGVNAYYHIVNNANWLLKVGAGYSLTTELFYLLNDNDPTLKTTYEAKWKGPEFNMTGQWMSDFGLYAGCDITYHAMKYDAKANWNNIETFEHPVSFIQFANGSGWNYNAQVGFIFVQKIGIYLETLHANWKTSYGTDRLYLVDGGTPETRMNGAFRKSNSKRIGITYIF